MAIESIRPQIERESQLRPKIEHPEIVDVLRHGNIYEVLRAPGVNRRDIEDYLSSQWHLFQNQIRQDYQIYSSEGSVPEPSLQSHFPVHAKEMTLSAEEHQLFHQDMELIRRYKADTVGPQGPGQDIKQIGESAVKESQDFLDDLTGRMIDQQMFQELRSKTGELNNEIQRIIGLVMSGQVDPEYVLIAAAKSNMLQNGTYFSWKGKRIMHLNDEMNKASLTLSKMDPNDQGYVKELQMVQTKTRSGGTQMQLELMDLQKFSQNIANTLDWVNNAIRMMAQMRQTPTQAIAAR